MLWARRMLSHSSRRRGRRWPSQGDENHHTTRQTSFDQAFLAEHKHCGAKPWCVVAPRWTAPLPEVSIRRTQSWGSRRTWPGLKKCADGERRDGTLLSEISSETLADPSTRGGSWGIDWLAALPVAAEVPWDVRDAAPPGGVPGSRFPAVSRDLFDDLSSWHDMTDGVLTRRSGGRRRRPHRDGQPRQSRAWHLPSSPRGDYSGIRGAGGFVQARRVVQVNNDPIPVRLPATWRGLTLRSFET